jgi:hypothetical protein
MLRAGICWFERKRWRQAVPLLDIRLRVDGSCGGIIEACFVLLLQLHECCRRNEVFRCSSSIAVPVHVRCLFSWSSVAFTNASHSSFEISIPYLPALVRMSLSLQKISSIQLKLSRCHLLLSLRSPRPFKFHETQRTTGPGPDKSAN